IPGFARALGEFGATITFVSNIPGETQTLALAIYALTQTPGGDAGVWRLAALSVCVSFVALVEPDAWVRRTAARRRAWPATSAIASSASPSTSPFGPAAA